MVDSPVAGEKSSNSLSDEFRAFISANDMSCAAVGNESPIRARARMPSKVFH